MDAPTRFIHWISPIRPVERDFEVLPKPFACPSLVTCPSCLTDFRDTADDAQIDASD